MNRSKDSNVADAYRIDTDRCPAWVQQEAKQRNGRCFMRSITCAGPKRPFFFCWLERLAYWSVGRLDLGECFRIRLSSVVPTPIRQSSRGRTSRAPCSNWYARAGGTRSPYQLPPEHCFLVRNKRSSGISAYFADRSLGNSFGRLYWLGYLLDCDGRNPLAYSHERVASARSPVRARLPHEPSRSSEQSL